MKPSVYLMDDVLDEDVQPVKTPGTVNNQERSGDRDLYWSWLMRQPTLGKEGKLRSCDLDYPEGGPQGYCDACSLPFMLIEATRKEGFKPTRYTKAHAMKLGVEGYLIRHNGQIGTDIKYGSDRKPSTFFEITRLSDSKVKTFTDEVTFIEWVERKFQYHMKTCAGQG
jgi:hypothetical protein